jgi:hypothetical protein
VQHFHLRGYFLASDPCGTLAAGNGDIDVTEQIASETINFGISLYAQLNRTEFIPLNDNSSLLK